MDETTPTFYVAVEGRLLADGVIDPLAVGGIYDLAICAFYHQLFATFSPKPRVSRLGNSLYRIRGKVRAKGERAWVMNAGVPILCNGELPSCFAPRKWVEGVFTLTLEGQGGCGPFREVAGCEKMHHRWRVLSIYRDDAFWQAIRREGDSDVPLSGQVIRALRYFEKLGNETHWSREKAIGSECDPAAHYLLVLEAMGEDHPALI
ncbi:MAG: hypothetical protein JJU11_17800 [Candidatus Sumerlaeia bacterium]|nr:hypothetical protein [Candidatus Sumerlaeia bacterium]